MRPTSKALEIEFPTTIKMKSKYYNPNQTVNQPESSTQDNFPRTTVPLTTSESLFDSFTSTMSSGRKRSLFSIQSSSYSVPPSVVNCPVSESKIKFSYFGCSDQTMPSFWVRIFLLKVQQGAPLSLLLR